MNKQQYLDYMMDQYNTGMIDSDVFRNLNAELYYKFNPPPLHSQCIDSEDKREEILYKLKRLDFTSAFLALQKLQAYNIQKFGGNNFKFTTPHGVFTKRSTKEVVDVFVRDFAMLLKLYMRTLDRTMIFDIDIFYESNNSFTLNNVLTVTIESYDKGLVISYDDCFHSGGKSAQIYHKRRKLKILIEGLLKSLTNLRLFQNTKYQLQWAESYDTIESIVTKYDFDIEDINKEIKKLEHKRNELLENRQGLLKAIEYVLN